MKAGITHHTELYRAIFDRTIEADPDPIVFIKSEIELIHGFVHLLAAIQHAGDGFRGAAGKHGKHGISAILHQTAAIGTNPGDHRAEILAQDAGDYLHPVVPLTAYHFSDPGEGTDIGIHNANRFIVSKGQLQLTGSNSVIRGQTASQI